MLYQIDPLGTLGKYHIESIWDTNTVILHLIADKLHRPRKPLPIQIVCNPRHITNVSIIGFVMAPTRNESRYQK